MPIAFTTEQQHMIRQSLREAALELIKDAPFRKIKVEQLTKEVGISKGAFYKFYCSKEALFYELLRDLHGEIYAPALKSLTDGNQNEPASVLCNAILDGYDALESSAYKRFWLEDSTEIMNSVTEDEKQSQHLAETELFRHFLNHYGSLAVNEDMAMDAIRTLIHTVYSRKSLGDNYEQILRWMAQGVCDHIFQ